MKLLATLNPSKACGPDEIPNWLLKEYAELLAFPVSKIINSSFKDQRLPKIRKFADVSPLPKVKPVEDLKKHLTPISLTPWLSKVAKECVVVDYVKSAVLMFSTQVSMALCRSPPQLKHLFTCFTIEPRDAMATEQLLGLHSMIIRKLLIS